MAEVNGRPGDGYVAVRVTGDVDTGTRAALTDALERALAVGSPSILVDLTGVRFFAVAGVHCVERAVGALEARGGSAHVVCPQPGAAWRVVSLLGLQQQWLVHHDVDAAVAGCTAGRWPSSAPVRGGDQPAEVAGRHAPVGTAGPGGPGAAPRAES